MASVLRTSLRRVAHTTDLSRTTASSIASFSSSSTRHNGSSEHIVIDVMKEMTQTLEPRLYSSASGSTSVKTESGVPQMTNFREQNFFKPIELRRDFREFKDIHKRPPPIGPGREARHKDIFLQLGIDPRFECENTALMSNLTTRMGKIQPRNVTRFSQRSQRLVGKAIKRAKMMGIVPIFSNRRW